MTEWLCLPSNTSDSVATNGAASIYKTSHREQQRMAETPDGARTGVCGFATFMTRKLSVKEKRAKEADETAGR